MDAAVHDLLPLFHRQTLLAGLALGARRSSSFYAAMTVVADFADRLRLTDSLGQLETLLAGAARDLGFRYFALVQHGDIGTSAGLLIMHNYPRKWVRQFAEGALHRIDPVQRAAAGAVMGFAWRDLDANQVQAVRSLMRDARAAGLGEGFTVPLHLPGERISSCSFVTSAGRPLPETALLACQLLAPLAYAAALDLIRTPRRQLPRLSPRQRECVSLMAQGKSDWEIGRILGLKEDTVTKYLNAARAAYGVARRTQLILLALRHGEIGFADLNWQYPP